MQAQTVTMKQARGCTGDQAMNQEPGSMAKQAHWLDQVDAVTHWMEQEDSFFTLVVGYGVIGITVLYLLGSMVRAIFR